MSNDLFAGRELCPDGACIGLIGPDGLCRECGRVGDSAITDPRLRNLVPPDPPERAGNPDANPDDVAGESGDDDFANRVLCPDGSCLGLVGADKTCNICGILAE